MFNDISETSTLPTNDDDLNTDDASTTQLTLENDIEGEIDYQLGEETLIINGELAVNRLALVDAFQEDRNEIIKMDILKMRSK